MTLLKYTRTPNWMYGYDYYEAPAPQIIQQTIVIKGRSPRFDTTTQTWWQFDDELHKYVDTGITKDSNWHTITMDTLE